MGCEFVTNHDGVIRKKFVINSLFRITRCLHEKNATQSWRFQQLRYLAFFGAAAALRALNFSTRPAVSIILEFPV